MSDLPGAIDQVSADLRSSRHRTSTACAPLQRTGLDLEIGQPPVGQLPWRTRVVAEYAMRHTNKPLGVAEYQLVEEPPKDLEASLPSVEQIERELGEVEE